MADEENEPRPGDEKPEVKDSADTAIESNETVDNDKESEQEQESTVKESTVKESTVKDEPDAAKKEEKSPKKVEKDQKDDKIVKKEKAKKKEETEDEDEDGDEDDDDEETLPPGLLERPLEVEGKREKKKVERLSASMISSPPEKKKVEIEKGTGKKLGDIPYIEHQLNITKVIDLKPLHRVLFLRVGSINEVKKNIRQFSGFAHGKDSKEHEKRVACLNKLVLAELKAICVALGLERGGTKVNLVDRVMDFLIKPTDKGLNVKIKTKKKSKSTGGKTKGTKRKRSKEPAKKGKASKDDDSPGSDSDEEEEEEEEQEEEEEDEEEEEEEESEEEAPKKKKAKTENKKPTPKKSVKENGKKEKPAPKKEAKKPKPAAKKKPAIESDSMSEDSEDEPIAKIKKSPPSNAEIKDLVKKILDGADLETVTMKTVVKQVYAKYPSFDLSDRKDFIKDTVREVIS